MAGQHRKCANCRFYLDAGMPGNGWCTHPKRQPNSGVKLLVRAGELACRNTWGGDLFQGRFDEDAPQDAAADLPGSDRDDEVTSVSIPSNKPAPAEDRVVRDRPAAQRQQPRDSNDAAHRDQEERARVMARGSRDALAHARKRFSTRQHASSPDDVVAGDNVELDAESDRVVTRQQRFSDRDFGAGLPPMRTAPVPREEVQERGRTAEDRFDTVPAIDPDFDMPGQRHRPEPAAAVEPTEEPPVEPSPMPDVPPEQLTAYEHVLQRARRIRETKQEHAQPLRRADYIPARDVAPQESAPAWQAASAPEPAPESFEELPASPSIDLEVEQPHDRHTRVAAAQQAEPWADEYVEDTWVDEAVAWDDAEDIDAVAPWPDAERDGDDEDGWEEDDYFLDEPAPRRTGWLRRLGFGRRGSEPTHDETLITRHAASHDAWTEDTSYDEWSEDESYEGVDDEYEGVDEYEVEHESYEVEDDSYEDGFVAERWEEAPAPRQWHDVQQPTRHADHTTLPVDEPVPAWRHDRDTARESARPYRQPVTSTPAWPEEAPAAQLEPEWSSETVFSSRGATSTPDYAEGLHSTAPVPPPVPASERSGGAWDVAGMLVRPAPTTRSRSRLTAELPDIDDMLFDEDRVVRAERHPVAREEYRPVEERETGSPRESYFRSSRYPQPEQADPLPDHLAQTAFDDDTSLPDLDSAHLDVRDAVARGAELIDRRIDIAPDIPRECRTCRSFRSADGGPRGWCTNEWAFSHRRMVNEDDLACVSAIGCWWMPADHLRLELDEDHSHVRTPRMDKLIARNRPAARKASGE